MRYFYQILILFLGLILSISESKSQISIDFKASTNNVCAPDKISFQDLSTSTNGKITKWEWNFFDGGNPVGIQNPERNYTNPGVYKVSLTVWDDQGNSRSLTKEKFIYAHPKPEANASLSDTFGCTPMPIQFHNLSKPGTGTIEKVIFDFGDGIGMAINENNPVYIYKKPGPSIPKLTVFNSQGCKNGVDLPKIRISKSPKANFEVLGDTSNCEPHLEVLFQNKTEGDGPLNFQWFFGDGTNQTIVNGDKHEKIKHLYTGEGKYTVKLIVTNTECGKSDTIIKENLIQLGKLTASFTTHTDTLCAGTSIQLTNTSSPTPDEAIWHLGNGQTKKGKSIRYTYVTPGTYQVKLDVSLKACKDSLFKSIEVHPKPIANFEADKTTACDIPFECNFKNLSQNATRYQWNFGDGNTSNNENPTNIYTKKNVYNVSLTAYNQWGCSDTKKRKKYIHVNKPEILKITPKKAKGKLTYYFQVDYTTLWTDKVVKFLWDFGDGTTEESLIPEIEHQYPISKKYKVKVKIITQNGCETEMEIEINTEDIGGGGAFVFDTGNACASRGIRFTDQSKQADQWLWHFGDGQTSTLQNPLHHYKKPGTYTVVLEIWYQGDFMDSVTHENAITIKDGPIRGFTFSKNCTNPYVVTFVPDTPNNADTCIWKFGDGTISKEFSPTHVYADTGLYHVVQIVKNKESVCVDSAISPIAIIDLKPDFYTSDTIFCKGKKIDFFSKEINPKLVERFQWSFGDGKTSKKEQSTHSYKKTGLFDVALIVEDTTGCIDTLVKPDFLKVGGPLAQFKVPSLRGCTPYHITIEDISQSDEKSPITQRMWNYGDGNSDTIFSDKKIINHLYLENDRHKLSLTVVDTFGCTDSKLVTITTQSPEANFSVGDSITCPGNGIFFTNNSDGKYPLSYFWNFGDDSTSTDKNKEHIYNKPGSYNPIMVVKDRDNCRDTFKLQTPIEIVEPKADFDFDPKLASCPPVLSSFTSKSFNAKDYSWNFGDGESSSEINPVHTYSAPGKYKINLLITSIGNCTDSITKTFEIEEFNGSFSMDTTTGCVPFTLKLNATAFKASKFQWDFKDGTVLESTQPIIEHTYNHPGVYMPDLILTGENEACKKEISPKIPVTVGQIKASFILGPNIFCDTSQIVLSNRSEAFFNLQSYHWLINNKSFSTQKNPTLKLANTGNYEVTLISTSSLGCVDTLSKDTLLKIDILPPIQIIGDSTICFGEEVMLKTKPKDVPNLMYRWNVNGNLITGLKELKITPEKTGTIPIKLYVKNLLDCADSSLINLTINPTPSIQLSPKDTTVCEDINLDLKASGGTQIKWFPPSKVNCDTCFKTHINIQESTSLFAVVSNAYGCENTDSLLITIKSPPKISVNKDGQICAGDSYQLHARGAEKIAWFPKSHLSNPNINAPLATPPITTFYKAIGFSKDGICPPDTGMVRVIVSPYPKINVPEKLKLFRNEPFEANIWSKDTIAIWKWEPPTGLSCSNCPNPEIKLEEGLNYKITATSIHGCTSYNHLPVTISCGGNHIYTPNTFTPNGDLLNDRFYIRAQGLEKANFMRIYNRWGALIHEEKNINLNNPTKGWDGKVNGNLCPTGVYVVEFQVQCYNGELFHFKNSFTLLR